MRESLHRFKFRGRREYASFFGHALAEELRPYAGNAFLVPVPVSRRRERERGYNQSLLLARAASRELHIPCLDLLCKTRENETQHELGRAAREQNVRNVYAVKPGKRLPGRAIVVDDIVSTGHTLAACVSALRKAGIEVCCCAAVADNSLSNVELPAKP